MIPFARRFQKYAANLVFFATANFDPLVDQQFHEKAQKFVKWLGKIMLTFEECGSRIICIR